MALIALVQPDPHFISVESSSLVTQILNDLFCSTVHWVHYTRFSDNFVRMNLAQI